MTQNHLESGKLQIKTIKKIHFQFVPREKAAELNWQLLDQKQQLQTFHQIDTVLLPGRAFWSVRPTREISQYKLRCDLTHI